MLSRDTMQKNVELIYKDYNKLLMSFIIRRVPNRFIAEDILQEVFMKVINKYAQLKDQKKLKSWIFQIARNSIIDYYRTEKPAESVNEDFIRANNPGEEDAYKRLQLSVLEMIRQLPLKYRQSLYLADYKGMTYRDIAERLKISDTCAKSRIQRARKLMKEVYLKCCHFEFDRDGKVVDYHVR